jgi:tetratricopeptide (TPR) repeat protein
MQPAANAAIGQQLAQQIARETAFIRNAEAQGMEPLKLGRLWAHLASAYEDMSDYPNSENAYNRALALFKPLPDARLDYAVVLDNLGSLYFMEQRINESYSCRKRSMAIREQLGDKIEIARGEAHLAEIAAVRHHFDEARRQSLEAYQAMVALNDPDATDLIAALSTLVYAECARSACPDSLGHARTALQLAIASYPADSVAAGHAHLLVGYAQWKTDSPDPPDAEMLRGIAIMRVRTPPGHPYLLNALEQYRQYLASAHRSAEADAIAREEKNASRGISDCPSCTVSVNALRAH